MKTLLIALALSLAIPIAAGACGKGDRAVALLQSAGYLLEVDSRYQRWTVTEKWYGLLARDKRAMILDLSMISRECGHGEFVDLLDPYTGQTVGRVGVTGLKILH